MKKIKVTYRDNNRIKAIIIKTNYSLLVSDCNAHGVYEWDIIKTEEVTEASPDETVDFTN